MRFIPLFALAIPLSGCILPPVMVAASYAGDALLAVGTDKTSSDHLLSMMEKRDCAMWRVIKGRPICQDWADGKDPYEKYRDPDGNQVATAGSDAGFTATMAKDSRQGVERGQSAANERRDDVKSGVLLAQAGGTVPVTTAADVRRANQPDRSQSDRNQTDRMLPTGPFNPAGVPPITSTADTPAPTPTNNAVTPAPLAPLPTKTVDNAPVNDGAPITQPIPPAATAENNKPVVSKPPVVAKDGVKDSERNRYVVIGSYRQQDNAQRVMREQRELKPVMQSVTVKGTQYYRVVAGPYTPTQAADIRASLKTKSHINADVARNCAGKRSGACIDINS